jgi:hypothetical protein
LRGYDFAQEILDKLNVKEQLRRSESGKKFSNTKANSNRKSSKTSKRKLNSECIDNEGDQQEEDNRFGTDNDVVIGVETAMPVSLSIKEEKLVKFDAKHKSGRAKWTIPDSFPDPKIAHAYLHPAANRNNEPFSWPPPSKEKIKNFCRNILGWTDEHVSYVILVLETTIIVDRTLIRLMFKWTQFWSNLQNEVLKEKWTLF